MLGIKCLFAAQISHLKARNLFTCDTELARSCARMQHILFALDATLLFDPVKSPYTKVWCRETGVLQPAISTLGTTTKN